MPSSLFPEVLTIKPKIFHDPRGYFFESFQANRYQEIGIKDVFLQDNFSHSVKNTLRGMHYQLHHPQGKLISVIKGKVFDVVIDIRQQSPTFGKWQGFELSASDGTQLYIPPGFAHGFYVQSDEAYFYYKCTNYFVPGDDYGIAWNDAEINIAWPLQGTPILSEKDKNYKILSAHHPEHLPLL